ncbi:hypothetical protein IVB69_02725 [Flavobacterium sp. J49]|uniref:hypothetical protein n=1 Tax=Flavobacterium sp. J49 TaxID=2718534 RepID=UPI001592D783|nr:hypothetical protein [Flavobacterium sp. J49]MBF6640387.1 hypothetical protein [Flavobacterium sp. J49]NIC01634.1 hypothetical protein [Flavobacterium sp. J49]
MKKVFYTIVFFILFFVIQRIPYIFDNGRVGFPFATHKHWFTTESNNRWNTSISTTHIIDRPQNIYLNFAIYSIIVFLTYCIFAKQNPFRLITNKTIGAVKSKWFRKTFELLGYSFIIFAIVQFLPFSYNFENGMAKKIGFPIVAYYVYDADCYIGKFFHYDILIANFVIVTIATFLIYLTIQLIKLILNKLKTTNHKLQ